MFRSDQSSTPTHFHTVEHPHTYADDIISGQNNNHISTTLGTGRSEVPAVSALFCVNSDSAAKSCAHIHGWSSVAAQTRGRLQIRWQSHGEEITVSQACVRRSADFCTFVARRPIHLNPNVPHTIQAARLVCSRVYVERMCSIICVVRASDAVLCLNVHILLAHVWTHIHTYTHAHILPITHVCA